ncbi:MAG: O-antigen ligase family protein [Planctomycetia bacterium]|nr:O-antigen ligase family protein [Planctomycetia bacterium]
MIKAKRAFRNNEKTISKIDRPLELATLFYRFCLNCFWAFLAFLVVLTLILPPEGNVRNGDFLPITFLWLLLFPLSFIFVKLGKKLNSPFSLSNKEMNRLKPEPDLAIPKKVWQKPGIAEFFVFCLIVWMSISLIFLLKTHSGNIRYAFNMFWIWSGIIGVFFLFRYLRPILTTIVIRSLLILIIGICLSESVFSIYTYSVRDPEFRKQYLNNPEKILAENQLYFPEGSAERILFENRLLNSLEPLGTFGLTNTLAGLLAPNLIILVGWLGFFVFSIPSSGLKLPSFLPYSLKSALSSHLETKKLWGNLLLWNYLTILISGILFCPIWICLSLTKSRSAYIAFGLGAMIYLLFIVCCFIKHKNIKTDSSVFYRKVKIGFFALFFLIVTSFFGALFFGLIDREVITEAGKSLSYRLDYWIASYRIILDHSLFGIGPGNFQTIYPQYILPTASEFIADPHHWAFEIASLFGIPALIFFLGFIFIVLFVFCHCYLRRKSHFNDSNLVDSKKFPNILACSDYSTISQQKSSIIEKKTEIINIETSTDNQIDIQKNNPFSLERSFISRSILLGSLVALLVGWFLSLSMSAPLDLDFVFIAFIVIPITFGLFSFLTTLSLKRQKIITSIIDIQAKYHKTNSNPIDHQTQTFDFSSFWESEEKRQKRMSDHFYSSGLIAALISILTNLSAAGGISYPSTIFCFWFFSALFLNNIQNNEQTNQHKKSYETQESKTSVFSEKLFPCPTLILLTNLIFISILIGLFWITGLKPVLSEKRQLLKNEAFDSIIDSDLFYSIPIAQNDYLRKLENYQNQYNERKRTNKSIELETAFKDLDQARSHLLQISPNSAPIRFDVGNKDFATYQTTQEKTFLKWANDVFEQAVLFSPNNAEYRVHWAQTLDLLQDQKAQKEAEKALELDQQMPHFDRKLSDELQLSAKRILNK